MSKPLSDRIAVVTGASRGIGRAVAVALAEAGAHVVAVARTVGALEELDDAIKTGGGSATLVPLDLRDFSAIDRLGAKLFERYRKLDILVGNAGVLGPTSPLSHIDPPAWDEVLAVNVTANWRLIRSFDPLLRASDAGRVVLVTSGVTAQARAYWGPYSVSKAAVDMLARIYASETAATNIKVNVFGPGPIRTRMRAQGFPGEDPMTLDTPEQVAPHVLAMCLPSFAHSGKFYSYPAKALLEFQAPKPIG